MQQVGGGLGEKEGINGGQPRPLPIIMELASASPRPGDHHGRASASQHMAGVITLMVGKVKSCPLFVLNGWKYVKQVRSRGQETLRLGSEGCWSEGWVAAAARGPQNGHSEPHSG